MWQKKERKRIPSFFILRADKELLSIVKLGVHNVIISSLGNLIGSLIASFFKLKMIDNLIYNHNFSFKDWLLLISKHSYFNKTCMPEFSLHRANIKTAEHCIPFCPTYAFNNLHKLSWETNVSNFWCSMISVTILKGLLCDKWPRGWASKPDIPRVHGLLSPIY